MIQSIFSPLQSKACITFEFITRRVLSIQEDPYQALFSWDKIVISAQFGNHHTPTTMSQQVNRANQYGGYQEGEGG